MFDMITLYAYAVTLTLLTVAALFGTAYIALCIRDLVRQIRREINNG